MRTRCVLQDPLWLCSDPIHIWRYIMYADKTGMINLEELEVKADEVTIVSGAAGMASRRTNCCPFPVVKD